MAMAMIMVVVVVVVMIVIVVMVVAVAVLLCLSHPLHLLRLDVLDELGNGHSSPLCIHGKLALHCSNLFGGRHLHPRGKHARRRGWLGHG